MKSSRYVQRASFDAEDKVKKFRLDYMGSAEFEFGSVHTALAMLRYGNCKQRVVPGVFFLHKKKDGTEKKIPMVVIAPSYKFSDGSEYFDKAVEEFRMSVQAAVLPNSGHRFKEWTDMDRVLEVDSTQGRKSWLNTETKTNVWFGVDAFVRNGAREGFFDEEKMKAFFLNHAQDTESEMGTTYGNPHFVWMAAPETIVFKVCNALNIKGERFGMKEKV